MERVRKGQGTLGKLVSDEEVVDQVTETLAGVRKLVTKVDSIRTELNAYTATSPRDKSVTEFGLDIYASPERFYRLGIVAPEMGAESFKQVSTSVDGGPATVTETRERDQSSYRFNAMIGRRVHDWTFRFGLFESTGGIGADYDWAKYNIKFNLDLFGYRSDIGPEARLGMSMRFWNIFYGKVTGEDLLTDRGHRGFSLGAGFRFTDEDLKGLVGLLF